MRYALTLIDPRGRHYTGTVTRKGVVVEVDVPGFDDSVLLVVERRVAELSPQCAQHTATVDHCGEEWTMLLAEVRP